MYLDNPLLCYTLQPLVETKQCSSWKESPERQFWMWSPVSISYNSSVHGNHLGMLLCCRVTFSSVVEAKFTCPMPQKRGERTQGEKQYSRARERGGGGIVQSLLTHGEVLRCHPQCNADIFEILDVGPLRGKMCALMRWPIMPSEDPIRWGESGYGESIRGCFGSLG